MASTSTFRVVLTTHLLAFGAGVVVGKSWNAEELDAYRTANETWSTKLRKGATKVSVGVAAVAVVVLAARAAGRSKS